MNLACEIPPTHPARRPPPVIVPIDTFGVPTRHHPEAARALVAFGAKVVRAMP